MSWYVVLLDGYDLAKLHTSYLKLISKNISDAIIY